jgi:hypothetical protein
VSGSSLCKQNQACVPQDDLGHNLELDIVYEVVTGRRKEVGKGKVVDSGELKRFQDSVVWSWIPGFCKPWSPGELIAQAVGGVATTPRERSRPETGKSKSQASWRSVWPIQSLDFRPGSGREGSRESRLLRSERRGRATVEKRGGIAGREEGRGLKR